MSMNSSITPIRALFMNFVYLNSLSELCMWILFESSIQTLSEFCLWIFYLNFLCNTFIYTFKFLYQFSIKTLYPNSICKLFYLNSAYKSSNLCIWILYPILFIIFSFYLNLPLKINSWHTIFKLFNFQFFSFFIMYLNN